MRLDQKYKTLLNSYHVNTPLRISHFMAQIEHESGGFKYLKELGNDAYFSKYEGRKDLGNTEAGDGIKFKGRGYIQITGRANYTVLSKDTRIDFLNNPKLNCTFLGCVCLYHLQILWIRLYQHHTQQILQIHAAYWFVLKKIWKMHQLL